MMTDTPDCLSGTPTGTLVIAEQTGQRLDRVLQEVLPEFSRTGIQRLIEGGAVRINGRPARSGQRVARGETLAWEACVAAPPAACLVPEAIPLHVLFADEHVLVLNKPRGLVVHPAPGHATGTLVHAVLAYTDEDLPEGSGPERPGIVHRLDRDTTGVMVVARTDVGLQVLRSQVDARTMERHYLVLVRGEAPFGTAEVDAPIGRHPRERQRMAVIPPGSEPPGRAARTRFHVLERFPGFTLLEARLDTGRTHQVRVHCAYIRLPVVGDPVYGPGPLARDRTTSPAVLAAAAGLGGQALHACSLAFDHPVTGERLTFTAPPPADFQAVLDALRTA